MDREDKGEEVEGNEPENFAGDGYEIVGDSVSSFDYNTIQSCKKIIKKSKDTMTKNINHFTKPH